jgi:hypothetical protein
LFIAGFVQPLVAAIPIVVHLIACIMAQRHLNKKSPYYALSYVFLERLGMRSDL